MVHNPIFPGYVWRQAFDFPEGFFEPGDNLRAEFRSKIGAPVLASVSTEGEGIWIDNDRVFVELNAAQTDDMRAAGCEVVTSFALERDSAETAIGAIITVPVSDLPTRASE